MAVEFKMPEVAETVVEGEIGHWLVEEGDFVQRDQPLLEVVTDKVTVEIPSPFEGVLLQILAPEGRVVKVGETIAIFGEKDEKYEPPKEEKPTAEAEVPKVPREKPKRTILAAPAVRRLARERGVDLSLVKGTGPRGRITKEDVLKFTPAKPEEKPELEERIPLRGVRRAIAAHMTESKKRAAHTLHVDEADVTNLLILREKAQPWAESKGIKLTYLPFIVKVVVEALKRYPILNASLDEEREEIVLKRVYNIGCAIATNEGLIVPVIKEADKKSIFQLAAELQELSEKARSGKLTLDEVQGGTFSITNVGSIGGLYSFPIINYPEVAILGVHKIQKRPVVRDNQVVVRDMVNLSLAFDHRVVDGAVAAQFTNEIIRLLESPELLLLETI